MFNTGTEAMVWTTSGEPLQGLTGQVPGLVDAEVRMLLLQFVNASIIINLLLSLSVSYDFSCFMVPNAVDLRISYERRTQGEALFLYFSTAKDFVVFRVCCLYQFNIFGHVACISLVH